jgi:hypothetical protein
MLHCEFGEDRNHGRNAKVKPRMTRITRINKVSIIIRDIRAIDG